MKFYDTGARLINIEHITDIFGLTGCAVRMIGGHTIDLDAKHYKPIKALLTQHGVVYASAVPDTTPLITDEEKNAFKHVFLSAQNDDNLPGRLYNKAWDAYVRICRP